jgi:hypothetical protein
MKMILFLQLAQEIVTVCTDHQPFANVCKSLGIGLGFQLNGQRVGTVVAETFLGLPHEQGFFRRNGF